MRMFTRKVLSLLLCLCVIGTNLLVPVVANAAQTGQIYTNSPNPYHCVGEVFGIVVDDPDLNIDPDSQQSVTVQVQSSRTVEEPETNAISINLMEEGVNSGRFIGFVRIANASNAGANPPEIIGENGDHITCTYIDTSNNIGIEEAVSTFITVAERVMKPTAQLQEGQVLLSSTTSGAEIYYTTDGSEPRRIDEDPNNHSVLFEGSPIPIEGSIVIKAIAVANEMADSEIATFAYNTIGVKVIAADGITPVPYARVELYDDFNSIRSEQTNEEGIIYINPNGLGTGNYTVRAFPTAISGDAGSYAQTVEITEPGKYTGDTIIAQLTTPMFTGAVKKPDGSYVTNGWLAIDKYFDEFGSRYLFGMQIQMDGTYKLPPLEDGKYKIRANPSFIDSGYLVGSQGTDITVVNNDIIGPLPSDLILNPIQLSGAVTDPNGNPVSNDTFNIRIRSANPQVGYKVNFICDNFMSVYRVGGLAAGSYILSAEPRNTSYTRSFEIPFTILENGSADQAVIDLQLTAPQLTGTVMTPDTSVPFGNGRVEIYDSTGKIFISDTHVESDGAFKVGGLNPGNYKIKAIPYDNSEYINSGFIDVEITSEPINNFTILLKNKKVLLTWIDSYEKGSDEIRAKILYSNLINIHDLTAEISGGDLGATTITLPYKRHEGPHGPQSEADVLFWIDHENQLSYGEYTLTLKIGADPIASENVSLNVMQGIHSSTNVVSLTDYQTNGAILNIKARDINGQQQTPIWANDVGPLTVKITAHVGEPRIEFYDDVIINSDDTLVVAVPPVSEPLAGNRCIEVFRGDILIARGGYNVGNISINNVYSKETMNEVYVSGEYLESYWAQNATAEVELNGKLITCSEGTNFWGELAFRFRNMIFETGKNYTIKIYTNNPSKVLVAERNFKAVPRLDIANPVISTNVGERTLNIIQGSVPEYKWTTYDSEELRVYVNGKGLPNHIEATSGNGLTVNNDTIDLELPYSLGVGEYNIDVHRGETKIGHAEFIVEPDASKVIKGSVTTINGAVDGGYVNIHKKDNEWGERAIVGHDGNFYVRKSRLNRGPGEYTFIAVPTSSSLFASSEKSLLMQEDGSIASSINIILEEAQVTGTVYKEGALPATEGNVNVAEIDENDHWIWVKGVDIAADGTYKISGLTPGKKYLINANPWWGEDYFSSGNVEVTYIDTVINNTNFTFSKPQITGFAKDFYNMPLPGDQYDVNVRSVEPKEVHYEWRARDGYFIIGNLQPGNYKVSIRPRGISDYTQSFMETVEVYENGIANPYELSFSYTQPKLTGTAKDINNNPLVKGYVEVYKGTWKNMEYVCWAPVNSETGEFKIGGLEDGSYYIRAGVGEDSSQFGTNSSSVLTAINIGTTTNVELKLTDKTIPRIRMIREVPQGSDNIELRMYNLNENMKNGLVAEVIQADGSSFAQPIIIQPSDMWIGWMDEFSREADLRITSEALRELDAGSYKLKLTYNGLWVANDDPTSGSGNKFKIVKWLRLNPNVVLPGEAGRIIELSPDRENEAAPWVVEDNGALTIKLFGNNGTVYTIPNFIDENNILRAEISEPLAVGEYSLSVYKGEMLMGMSHLSVGTPAIRGVYNVSEDEGSLKVYGDHLSAYRGSEIVAKLYKGTATTPILSSSEVYVDRDIFVHLNKFTLLPGTYRLELIIDGSVAAIPNGGEFRVIDLLFSTPGYIMTNASSGREVTLNANKGRTPWTNEDELIISIVEEKTGRTIYETDQVNEVSTSTASFILPEMSIQGRYSIIVFYMNDMGKKQSVGYSTLDIVNQTQITGQIKDTSGNPVPFGEIFVEYLSGEKWGMNFKADSNGTFAIYGLKQGEYRAIGKAPRGEVYIDSQWLDFTINPDYSSNITEKEFTIVTAKVISGTISLPDSEVAPAGGVEIWLGAINEDDLWFGGNAYIEKNKNSAEYKILVPATAAAYTIQLWSNAPGSINAGVYYNFSNPAHIALTQAEATPIIVNNNDIYGVDMTVVKGNEISGTIYLPGGIVAPVGGMKLRVSAIKDNDTKDHRDDVYAEVNAFIPEGENSATFKINVPALSGYILSFNADKTEGFLNYGIYGEAGVTTHDRRLATKLDLTSSLSSIYLHAIPAKVISGKISLPGTDKAPADGVSGWVEAWYDGGTAEDERDDYYFGKEIYIKEGQNSVEYSLLVPELSGYRIKVYGQGNELIDGAHLYKSTGSVFTVSEADIIDLSDNGLPAKTNADIALVKGKMISGTITLPEPASEDRVIGIHAFADMSTPSRYDDIDAGIKLLIKKGITSVNYSLFVPAHNKYIVEYNANPEYNYENTGFYSDSGTVFDYKTAKALDLSTTGQTGINLSVSNRVALVITKAVAIAGGSKIRMTFNKPIDLSGIPSAPAGFSIKVGTDEYELSSIETYSTELILNLKDYKIFKDYTNITLSYDAAAGIKSYDGKPLASISDMAVTNNSDRTVSIVTGFANGALLNKDAKITAATTGETISIKENGSVLVSNQASVAYVSETEGTHTITVSIEGRKTDKVISFTIDKTAPVITINGATNAINNPDGVMPDVSFAADCIESSKIVTLNGQVYDGSSIKKAGIYILTASAKDEAGNIGTVSKEFKISWDTSAPIISVTGIQNGNTYDITADALVIEIGLTSSAAENSNLEKYYYQGTLKKPDGTVENINNNSVPAVSGEGKYRLEVLAVNPSYNHITSSKVVEFTVDNTAPEARIDNVTNNKKYNTSVTPVISLTDTVASQQALLANATFTLTKDGNAIPYSVGNTVSADGVYTFTVKTKDIYGHDSNTAVVAFTIDKTKPVITISGALNGYTYKDQDITVTIKKNEGTLTVTNNGVPVALDTNGQVTFKADANSISVVKLVAIAKDDAGNISEQQLSFTIDRLAVNIIINGVTDGMLTNNNPAISFTTFEGDIEKSGTTSTIDGNAFAGGVYSTEGTHQLVVSYTSGSNSYSKSVSFTIDKTLPVVSYNSILKNGTPATSAVYAKAGDSIKVRANISDSNGIKEAFFSIGNAITAIPMKLAQGYYEGEFIVENGNYPLTDIFVTARDNAGNSIALKNETVKVAIDNIKPTVSGITNPLMADGKNGIFKASNMKITLTAGTAEDTILYNLNNVSGEAIGTKQLTPEQGTNILVYRAQDLAGNLSDQKVYVFEYDSIKPANVAMSTPATGLVNTESVTISGSVAGEGGKAGSKVLIKRAGELISSVSIKSDNTFVADGIKLVEGINNFTVTAVDLAGNESSIPTMVSRTLDSTAPILGVNKIDDTHYTITVNENVALPIVKFNGIVITDPLKITAVTVNEVVRQYNVETPEPIEGTNTLNASAADAAGNIGTGSYSSTYIPANTAHNDVQLNDNSTMDIPDTAFNSSVQMLVKTVDSNNNNTSYKPLGATVSFEFVNDDNELVEPVAPLVIRKYIGIGLNGVALLHIDNAGVVDKTVTATVKNSAEFDMNNSTAINNLGTFDEDEVAIYIRDTGYIVFKTTTFSGYAAVQDVTAPVIELTSTAFDINKAGYASGLMKIEGTLKVGGTGDNAAANDATASISEVNIDGVVMNLGNIEEGLKDSTFSIPLNLPDGTHEVTIKATDAAGNVSTLTRTYLVDITPAAFTATVPTNVTNRDNIEITINTNEVVEVFFNGVSVGHYNGTSVIPYELTNGAVNTINVTAVDTFENESDAQVISVTRDSNAPSIVITGISDNGIYGSARNIIVAVTDTDPEYNYTVTMDGVPYTQGTPYAVEGQHTLMVNASDSFGNISSSIITFTIDTSVPMINLSGAENGGVYKADKIIAISVENADELTVTKSVDGQSPEVVTMDLSGGTITLGSANEQHTYKITVTAKKTAESVLVASDSVSFIVDRKAPVVTSTTAAQTEAASINLTGTVDEICDIYLDGNKVISENPAGTFSITGQNLELGAGNSFTIIAVDQAGNETAITVNVERKEIKNDIPGGQNPGGFIPNVPVTPVTPVHTEGVISLKPVLTGSTAIATATAKDIDAAFKQVTANAKGIKTISIQLEEVAGAKVYAQELPSSIMQAGNNKQNIVIETPVAAITIPGKMFTTKELSNKETVEISVAAVDVSSLSKEVAMAVSNNKPVIDISVSIDGKLVAWNNPDAPVTVSVDYTPTVTERKNPEHIVVWYINEEGKIISVPSGRYNPATGKVTFTTTHFSKYAIGYANKTFSDISSYGWAKNQIETLASKGIISGTTTTTFAPGKNITRADFMVLLVKALGLTAKVDSNFADIKTTDYYYEAVGIAKKLGITSGSGDNQFKPKEYITRQDMMVLVNKALQLQNKITNPGDDSTLTVFTDADSIAAYAKESVSNLVNEGILVGNNNRINPLGNATRAEIAVIVYKIYNK